MEKYASDSLKMLSDRGISFQSSPSEFVRGSGGVSVIEKATGKMLVGFAAPSEKNLIPWLKEHTSFQVLLHKKKGWLAVIEWWPVLRRWRRTQYSGPSLPESL